MNLPEKKQRWVYHAEVLPQPAGAGVTRRVLAYTDGLMCVENTFEKGAGTARSFRYPRQLK